MSFFREPDYFQRTGFYLHAIGVVSLLVAILSGRQAEGILGEGNVLEPLVEQHELMGYLTLWLMAMLWVWQFLRHQKNVRWEKGLFLLIFCIGLGLMTYGAHLGGEMVYRHGAGVTVQP